MFPIWRIFSRRRSACWRARRKPKPGPLSDQVRRQVDTMRRQVDHYLARARAAGSVNVLGNRTPVAPVLSDLARVLDPHSCRTRHRASIGIVRPTSISAASVRTWKRWRAI